MTNEAVTAGAENSDVPMVTVAVVGARNLRALDWSPVGWKATCVCTVKCKGVEICRTGPSSNPLEPLWQVEAKVEYVMGDVLEFAIWEQEPNGKPVLLGKASLEGAKFDAGGFNGELQLKEAAHPDATIKVKVKTPDTNGYPQLQDSEFTVTVEKDPYNPREPLGLDLDIQDGVNAWVTRIKPGRIKAVNDTLPARQQIAVGDFITKVNSVDGDVRKILDSLTQDAKLELVVRRPVEFSVAVERTEPHESLGLAFPNKPSGNCLVVMAIGDGLVKDWNASHPDAQVKVLDRIVAVGGQKGIAVELQGHTVAGKLRLTFVRPTKEGGQGERL